jgi:hypothetical protein
MAKIVATFICLHFIFIARTDVRAAVVKPRVVIAHAAMNFRVAPLWVAQDQQELTGSGLAITHGAHGVGLAIYPKQPDADALHPAQVPLNSLHNFLLAIAAPSRRTRSLAQAICG